MHLVKITTNVDEWRNGMIEPGLVDINVYGGPGVSVVHKND